MSQKKSKFYVVWQGHNTGIFDSWEACKLQIREYPGAQYKSYPTRALAEIAYQRGYEHRDEQINILQAQNLPTDRPVLPSWAVDAACNGQGLMEYRGVDTQSGTVIFSQGPFTDGTNNVGEFLAIVHALALLKKKGTPEARNMPIYSDSTTALAWVRKQTANTKMAPTAGNAHLRQLIARAEIWLRTNAWGNPLLKWETLEWGEIPADYGRK